MVCFIIYLFIYLLLYLINPGNIDRFPSGRETTTIVSCHAQEFLFFYAADVNVLIALKIIIVIKWLFSHYGLFYYYYYLFVYDCKYYYHIAACYLIGNGQANRGKIIK